MEYTEIELAFSKEQVAGSAPIRIMIEDEGPLDAIVAWESSVEEGLPVGVAQLVCDDELVLSYVTSVEDNEDDSTTLSATLYVEGVEGISVLDGEGNPDDDLADQLDGMLEALAEGALMDACAKAEGYSQFVDEDFTTPIEWAAVGPYYMVEDLDEDAEDTEDAEDESGEDD